MRRAGVRGMWPHRCVEPGGLASARRRRAGRSGTPGERGVGRGPARSVLRAGCLGNRRRPVHDEVRATERASSAVGVVPLEPREEHHPRAAARRAHVRYRHHRSRPRHAQVHGASPPRPRVEAVAGDPDVLCTREPVCDTARCWGRALRAGHPVPARGQRPKPGASIRVMLSGFWTSRARIQDSAAPTSARPASPPTSCP